MQVAPRVGAFAALRWCPFWPFVLLLSLLIPSEFSFYLGTLRLTPYRLVLIAAFLPSLIRLLSGRAGRITLIDGLLFLHILWAYIVISHHHGMNAALESGGIRMFELGGAYLIARAYITDEKTFRGAVAAVLSIICLLAPITLLESLTGFHAIKVVAAKLTGQYFVSGIEDRFGLARAFGPFDHPILYGVFAASGLGIAWFRAVPKLCHPRPRIAPLIGVMLAALSSVSSGALAALMTQLTLLIWEKKTRNVPSRWKLFTALLVVLYVVVDLISNRSGIKVFLHYLTFSAATAYNRIIIFEFGIQDVWRNPIFGIGFNVWTRPLWMHSTSMDNFWLVQAVTFGIPGFLTIALPVLLLLFRRWRGLGQRLVMLRMGWVVSMIGMILAASTVHFWNNLFVYFAFFIGMGAWFLNVDRKLASQG